MSKKYSVCLNEELEEYINGIARKCFKSKSKVLYDLIEKGKKLSEILEGAKDFKYELAINNSKENKKKFWRDYAFLINQLFISDSLSEWEGDEFTTEYLIKMVNLIIYCLVDRTLGELKCREKTGQST